MSQFTLRPQVRTRNGVIAAVVLIVCTWLAVTATTFAPRADKLGESEATTQGRREGALYYPTPKQWASLTTAPVTEVVFRAEHLTEGKIGVDEDRATLVFSPYSGRVTKLLAKPGDTVKAGQPLFIVEAPDMVQAQNDFIAAISNLNKARRRWNSPRSSSSKTRRCYESRAGPLRDLQQSQATARAAENDVRSSQTSLEMTRNRLRILGMTDDEITKFSDTGAVSPQMTIYSPITGTVIQRKVGPGQYVNTSSQNSSASDPTFLIGDLSTVWLIAYVRESDAPSVQVGQALHFTVLAYPNRVFPANISFVATSLDTGTRRLLVRATIDNSQHLLRPEMFASVTILTGEGDSSPAVPRDAIIYDGKTTHVWVARDDKSVERRDIKTGLSNGQMIQVIEGLRDGEIRREQR